MMLTVWDRVRENGYLFEFRYGAKFKGGRCLGSGRRASAPIVSFMRSMVRLQFHTNKNSLLKGFGRYF